MIHNKEKNELIQTDQEQTQMLELSHKDIKQLL